MRSIKKAPSGNPTRLARPNPVGGCPLTAALAAVGGKWKLIITHMERLTAQPDATTSGAQPTLAADSVESGGY
jgi:DNA-binding HxlR family transcriptional regulator